MKKIIIILTTFAILTSNIISVFATEKEVGYLPPESIYEPVDIVSLQSHATANVNGVNYLYVATNNGYFNVYNLDTNVLEEYYKVSNMSSVWMHFVASDGMVYYGGDGYIDKYDPFAHKLYHLGQIAEQWCVMACEDEDKNIYFGTYPSAKLIKYNPKTGVVTDCGRMDERGRYANNLAYYKGHIYISVMTDTDTYMKKINVKDLSDQKRIDFPKWENYTFKDRGYYKVVRNKLIMSDNERYMAVMNLDTEEFTKVDTRGLSYTTCCTEELDGKVYMLLYDLTNKYATLHSMDIETLELTDLKTRCFTAAFANYGKTILNFDEKIHKDMGGPCMVGLREGKIFIINLDTKKIKFNYDTGIKGAPYELYSVECDSDGDIYTGVFRNGGIGVYDSVNHKIKKNIWAPGQTEDMLCANDKMYFGCYPGAPMSVYDKKKDKGTKEEDGVKIISQNINNDIESKIKFDRIRHLTGDDERVIFTTYPYRATNGCGFGIIDTKTDEIIKYVDSPIKEQTIMSTDYKDGFLYIGTSIYGGSTTYPTEKEAHILVYDIINDKKVKDFIPKCEDGIIEEINGIKMAPDGELYATTLNRLYLVDVEKESISKVCDYNDAGTPVSYMSVKMRLNNDDIYFYCGGKMRAFNTVNKTSKNVPYLDNSNIMKYTFGKDGNLYFYQGAMLKRLNICDFEVTEEKINLTKSKLDNGVSMKLGKNISNIKGEPFYIDDENVEVFPFTENDRTVVPLRFVGEAFNMKVGWKEEDKSVTLEGKGKKIKVKIGEDKITVNDSFVLTDVPPFIRDKRTYLPLRAISESLDKKVFYDESGIIVISEDEINFDENELVILNAYFNYLVDGDLEDKLYFIKRQEEIEKNGGTIIYENDFEKKIRFRKNPTPGVTPLCNADGEDKVIEFRKERVFDGEQSIYLKNSTEGLSTIFIGFETGLVPVENFVTYDIYFKQYTLNGSFFNYEIEAYDENKVLLNNVRRTMNLTNGIWKDNKVNIYMPDKNIKYVNIRLYDFGCYTIDSYIDSLLVVGH